MRRLSRPTVLIRAFTGALSANPPYKYAQWNSTVGKWSINASSIAQVIRDTMGGPSKISDNAMFFFVPSSDVCTSRVQCTLKLKRLKPLLQTPKDPVVMECLTSKERTAPITPIRWVTTQMKACLLTANLLA